MEKLLTMKIGDNMRMHKRNIFLCKGNTSGKEIENYEIFPNLNNYNLLDILTKFSRCDIMYV